MELCWLVGRVNKLVVGVSLRTTSRTKAVMNYGYEINL